MSSVAYRLAHLCDDDHFVAWSFQARNLAERLIAGDTVRPDGRRSLRFMRPRYRHLRQRAHEIFGWPDRTLFWAYGCWEQVCWQWGKLKEGGSFRSDVFLTLRIPRTEVLLLDSDTWDYALMRLAVGHRPGGCAPGCRTVDGYWWPCSIQRDFYRRAEEHHGDALWHVEEELHGEIRNQDDVWVQRVMETWDQVFLPARHRRTELIFQTLRPEWVVSARPVSEYGRRPSQPAPDVTYQPAFLPAQVRQEKALLSHNPWVVCGPTHMPGPVPRND